jgi:hypothetical protein
VDQTLDLLRCFGERSIIRECVVLFPQIRFVHSVQKIWRRISSRMSALFLRCQMRRMKRIRASGSDRQGSFLENAVCPPGYEGQNARHPKWSTRAKGVSAGELQQRSRSTKIQTQREAFCGGNARAGGKIMVCLPRGTDWGRFQQD